MLSANILEDSKCDKTDTEVLRTNLTAQGKPSLVSVSIISVISD